jgi:hypothetical protein
VKKKVYMRFKEAMELANRIGIVGDEVGDERFVYVNLKDGSRIRVESNYEEDWSDVTPGNGIEPPTCCHETEAAV